MHLVVNNQKLLQTDSATQNTNTSNRDHLHRPTANISHFQKSAYYFGIKIFNNLPLSFRSVMNKKAQFKASLKKYLKTN